MVLAGALGYAAALIPVSLATSFGALAASFAFVGLMNGVLDVSMNVHGLAVERHLERPVLSSLHAAFSFGALGGAAVGGLVAAAGVGVEAHLWTAAALGAVVAVAATRLLLPRDVDAAPEGPSFARPTRALALVGLFAFCVLLSEGAVNDWAAVYLHGELGTGQGQAAAGLAAFSLTMGIGRLAGDPLTERLGPTRLARGGALAGHHRNGPRPRRWKPAGRRGGLRRDGPRPGRVCSRWRCARRPTPARCPARRWRRCPPWATSGCSPDLRWWACSPDCVGLRAALVLVVALCATAAVLAGAVRAPVRAG